MEKVILSAKKGDEDAVTQEVQLPENMAEAIKMWGEDETFKMARQQKVIRMQSTMRRPKGGKQAEELYQRLILTKKLSDEVCRQISGFTGTVNSGG